jgi:hypothetical protein
MFGTRLARPHAAFVLLLALHLPVFAFADEGEEPKPPKLKAGQTVHGEISTGGAPHVYRIKAAKEASVRIVVSATGVAIAAAVVGANGARIEPSHEVGGQAFEIAAGESGTWLLELRAAGGGEAGRYTVKVEAPK